MSLDIADHPHYWCGAWPRASDSPWLTRAISVDMPRTSHLETHWRKEVPELPRGRCLQGMLWLVKAVTCRKETTMGNSRNTLTCVGIAVVFLLASSAGRAVAGNNPVDERWWPSEFGADDQTGAVKYITPEKRVAAAQLVKKGKTATLGMPYYNGMPLVPGRTYALSIPGGGTPTHGPLNWPGEAFDQTFMDELVTAEIGQVGTQWDGLAHPMIRIRGVEGWKDGNYFYNKHRLEDVGSPRGLKKDGTEHVAEIGFFTRGLLIDVAGLKGVTRLDRGYAITMADYQAALKAQGVADAGQGDVVLLRTGWNSLWKDYNKPPEKREKDNAE